MFSLLYKLINPEYTYENTGYLSNGQELIQKKVTLAISEALEKGIDPEEILVVVMWSGTFRKAWYIDNPDIMRKMIKEWSTFVGGMSSQFTDLKNKLPENDRRVQFIFETVVQLKKDLQKKRLGHFCWR